MKRKWTESQSRAIEAKGGSILVSAAAGSGKTAVLVERIINKITDSVSPVRADRLLVVTFTKAAARELKERLYDTVSALLKENPGDLNLINQQMLLPSAKICTIDSFCNQLVRENFQLIDISSDFKTGDKSEMDLMKVICAEEAVEKMYAKNDSSFLLLVELLFIGRDDKNLVQTLVKLYDHIMAYPFPRTVLKSFLKFFEEKDVNKSEYGKIVLKKVKNNLLYCKTLSGETLVQAQSNEDYSKKLFDAVSSDCDQIDYILSVFENGTWDEKRKALLSYNPKSISRSGKVSADDAVYAVLKKQRDNVKEKIKNQSELMCCSSDEYREDTEFFIPAVKSLIECMEIFIDIFDKKKKERATYDFSDIAHMALELLVRETDDGYESTVLAKEISKDFDEIFIDEYQDTNKAQDLIFSSISNNNIFRVGDAKQSIYSFRQAMPELLLELKEKYEPYNIEKNNFPAKIILKNNFRSRKEVTDIVNFIFSQIMTKESANIDYDYEEQLVPSASYIEKDDAVTELHLLDIGEMDSLFENKDDCQAKYTASIIKKMLDDGFKVKDGDGERKAEYKDFVILLRSASGKGVKYAEELRKIGIPSFTEVSGQYLLSTEISLVLNILKIIDNPKQDIPLLSVMMSPVFGFTPDDMTELKKEKGFDLYSSLLASKDRNNEKVKYFLNKISSWRNLSLCLGVSELVNEIYDDASLPSIFEAADSSGTKKANLMLFADYAELYEKNGFEGLTGFLNFIEKLSDKKQDISASLGLSDQANVVKIMTIHGSKGLEFPVCILADIGKKFNNTDLNAGFIMSGKHGFGIKRRDIVNFTNFETLSHRAVRISLEKAMKSEEMRVLYVALTRAKEKLIMIYADKDPLKTCENCYDKITNGMNILDPVYVLECNSFSKWIITSLLRHKGFQEIRKEDNEDESVVLPCESDLKVVLAKHIPQKDLPFEKEDTAKADEDIIKLIEERAGYKYKYEALSKVVTKRAASETDENSIDRDYFASSSPSFLTEGGLTSAEKGIATHTFMQFCDFKRAKENLDEEIERLRKRGTISEAQSKGINKKAVQRFFGGELSKRIISSKNIMREKKFTIEVPISEIYPNIEKITDENMMIQGIADCAFEEDGELVVVDYKTDRVENEEELKAKYSSQVLIYKKALALCTGVKVKETLLYSFALGKEISVQEVF